MLFLVLYILLFKYLFLFCISSDELEKHEDYFVNFAIDLLSAYKVLTLFLCLSLFLPCSLSKHVMF